MRLPLVVWACDPPSHAVTAMIVTSDRRHIVTGAHTGHLVIWDLRFGEAKAVSPRTIYVGSPSAVLCVGECWHEHHSEPPGVLTDTAIIACCDNGTIFKCDPRDGRCLRSVSKLLPGRPHKLKMFGNGHYAACIGDFPGVVLIDVDDLVIVNILGRPDWFTAFTLVDYQDRDGEDFECLMAASQSGVVKVFPVWKAGRHQNVMTHLRAVRLANEGTVVSMATNTFSRSCMAALFSRPDTFQLYSIDTFELLTTVDLGKSVAIDAAVFLSPNHLLVNTKLGGAWLYALDVTGYTSTSPTAPKLSEVASQGDGAVATVASSQLQSSKHLFSFAQDNVEGTTSTPLSFPIYHALKGRTSSEPWLICRADCTGTVKVWSLSAKAPSDRQQQELGDIEAADIDAQPESGVFERPELLCENSLENEWRSVNLAGLPNGVAMTAFTSVYLDRHEGPSPSVIMCMGYEDGRIVAISLLAYCRALFGRADAQLDGVEADASAHDTHATPVFMHGHKARVTSLLWPKTMQRLLVSGSADHTVRVFDINSGQQLFVFRDQCGAISSLTVLPKDVPARLQSCVCSVAEDKSIALYDVDRGTTAVVVGGHAFPITGVFWKPADEFMVAQCSNGAVYIWHLHDGRLESTAAGQIASDIVSNSVRTPRPRLRPLPVSPVATRLGATGDLVVVLTLDLETMVSALMPNDPGVASPPSSPQLGRPNSRTYLLALSNYLISVLLHWGNRRIDRTAQDTLGLFGPCPNVQFGVFGSDRVSLLLPQTDQALRWRLSPRMATENIFCLSALTQARSRGEETGEREVAWLMIASDYAVGESTDNRHAPRSIRDLAIYWGSRNFDISQSARILMRVELESMDDRTLRIFLHRYQSDLSSQPRTMTYKELLSVLMLAIILHVRPEAVDANTRKRLAQQIVHSLTHQRTGPTELGIVASAAAVAFSLLSRIEGFKVDTVTARLVQLSNETDKLLNLAGNNALRTMATDCPEEFVESISLQLSRSSQYSNGVLQVIKRMINERPLLLVQQLPVLIHHVMACYHPGALSGPEEALSKNAYSVLIRMKNFFPMVDATYETASHPRLAVGSVNGEVIIYDTKTSSKIHEFKAHDSNVNALILNMTGKKLATLSIGEQMIKVWQIQGAFLGMLGSSSTKLLLQRAVDMTTIASLPARRQITSIRFEWNNDKLLRLIAIGAETQEFPL